MPPRSPPIERLIKALSALASHNMQSSFLFLNIAARPRTWIVLNERRKDGKTPVTAPPYLLRRTATYAIDPFIKNIQEPFLLYLAGLASVPPSSTCHTSNISDVPKDALIQAQFTVIDLKY